jgi:ribosome-binding protein aMBF1 (putative translation factor)
MTAANSKGQQDYEEWRTSLVDTPEKKAFHEEIAAEQDLWLQLVEARIAAGIEPAEIAARMGVTKAVVTRLEKNALRFRLATIRRYVQALGRETRCPSKNR